MLPLLFPLFKAAPAVLALIGTGASVDDPVRVYPVSYTHLTLPTKA